MMSVTLEYSMELLLTIPDCSSGRKLLEIIRDRNCFWTLSSVLSALSTLDCTVGSRSGTAMENPSLGLLSLSVIDIPHSTVLLLDTEVVSAMRVDSDAFVVYSASMSSVLSIMSPLNFTELPSWIVKSLDANPRATNR